MNVHEIRKQFPILNRIINDNPLVYLDNAASSQKPKVVLEAIETYYKKYSANVHRGIHTLSQEATLKMEKAREKVQEFINAKHTHEVIFTKGTTESINILAYSLTSLISKGDEVIISALEHHSNIVPWQMLCERTGAILKIIPINNQGELQLEEYEKLLSEKTKIVAVNHISNALGVINPVKEIIDKAHKHNAWAMIDGAQAAPHATIDVQDLDADFYVFSGHKMYAPTGTGILYGKEELLEKIPPFLGGGEMIETVTFEKTTYAGLPFKFEAGTPNIAGNIVLGTAIDYINSIGRENIQQHESNLLSYAQKQLEELEEIYIYAQETQKAGALSFNLKIPEIHPSDVGFILDKQGIAVRTGHHCTQPIMDFFTIKGTIRASFAVYNTQNEIDELVEALKKAIILLK